MWFSFYYLIFHICIASYKNMQYICVCINYNPKLLHQLIYNINGILHTKNYIYVKIVFYYFFAWRHRNGTFFRKGGGDALYV